jgi:hypothetical protein
MARVVAGENICRGSSLKVAIDEKRVGLDRIAASCMHYKAAGRHRYHMSDKGVDSVPAW